MSCVPTRRQCKILAISIAVTLEDISTIEPRIRHLPFRRRERAMLRFRQMKSLQKFASVHASIANHFYLERHLVDRQTYRDRRSVAMAEWQSLMA